MLNRNAFIDDVIKLLLTDFDDYAVAIALYQAIKPDDKAYVLVQKRVAELIFATLQANDEGKLKQKLTPDQIEHYQAAALRAVVLSGNPRASLCIVNDLLGMIKSSQAKAQSLMQNKDRFFQVFKQFPAVDVDFYKVKKTLGN